MIFKSYWKLLKLSLAIVLAILFVLVSVLPLTAQEDEETCKGLVILQAWARPGLEEGNSAIYGIIVNLSDEDEMLDGVDSNIAETLELHESSMTDNGMMEMRPLEDGIHIPAHGTAQLEPGGMHVMAIGLSDTLEVDTSISVELEFMNAGDISLEVPVREPQELVLRAFNVEHCDQLGLWGPWARPTGMENANSAIYGVLLNLSDEDDTLIKVSTDVADAVELHETVMQDDGTIHMSMLEDGILISAGSYVMLEPGGLHIMLINVAEPLSDGTEIEIDLDFETAKLEKVVVPVVDETSEDQMSHSMNDHPSN